MNADRVSELTRAYRAACSAAYQAERDYREATARFNSTGSAVADTQNEVHRLRGELLSAIEEGTERGP